MLLGLADRSRERDLAVGGEGKATGGMEEGLGRGIGAGHEIHAEDGKGNVDNGDASQDDQERVLETRGRPRGEHRKGGFHEAGVGKGAGERGARPRTQGGSPEGREERGLLGEERINLPGHQAVEESGVGRGGHGGAVGDLVELGEQPKVP